MEAESCLRRSFGVCSMAHILVDSYPQNVGTMTNEVGGALVT